MTDDKNLSESTARIVLFGSEGGYSRAVLEQLLIHGLYVVAVVITDKNSRSDRSSHFPIAVRQAGRPGSLAEMACENKADVLRTQDLSDDSFICKLAGIQANNFLVACFTQKIPARIWKHMNVPCWNLHPSLLPRYRGPSPLYWQIKNGEPETGLTLHEVSSRIDAGDIVARMSISLPVNPNKLLLDNWVAEHGVRLFCKTLDRYQQGKLKPEPQDEMLASYFSGKTENSSIYSRINS